MNIKEELLKEHSKVQVIRLSTYIGDDPSRFKILMDIFFNSEYRITQRASWVVSYCVQNHPKLIRPYLKKMILHLAKPGLHDAVKRNIVRILQFVDIPRSLWGHVVTNCFQLLNSASEPIAVKVFSMTVLFNIAKHEPDLQSELKMMIEDQMPYASAGFISRGKKILSALKK